MDQEKIGKFIYTNRRKLNLTQAQLADKLSVTSQAISKWENGRGIPDIEMLNKLSEIFQVDISEIINGENKEKEIEKDNKKQKIVIFSIILTILILILVSISRNNKDNFNFKPLTSNNSCFDVKGVVAYNKSKKSIYISNIDCIDETNNEKYLAVECILYEKNKNIEKKISSTKGLKKFEEYDINNTKTLSLLLKDIEFNIDNYDCACSSTTCNNLYIKINALNTSGKIVTYDIPIELDNKCLNN